MTKVYTLHIIGGKTLEVYAGSPTEALKNAGGMPVSKISLDINKTLQVNYGTDRVIMSRTEALQFTQQMAIFIGVIPNFGQAVAMSLSRLRDQKAVKRRLRLMNRKLANSASLTEAIESIGYPREFLPILAIAEKNSNLAEAFTRVATTMTEQQGLKQTITQALVTPVLTVLVLLVTFVVMLYFVFPRLIGLFTNSMHSAPTGILAMDMFMVNNKGAILIALISAISLFLFWVSTSVGRKMILQFIFMFPLLKDIIMIYRATKFVLALEMPLLAAQTVQDSVHQILDAASSREKKVYRRMASYLEEGKSLGESIGRTKYFPDDFSSWVGSVEEAGQLTVEITTIRKTYEELLKQRFNTVKTFIGPILVLVAGSAIVVMAGALYAPILDLVQSFMSQTQ